MGKLVNIGYGNVINPDQIVAIVRADSAPVKRQIQMAKEQGTAVDATQGRKTQGVIFTNSSYMVLSALLPETISNRLKGEEGPEENQEGGRE